MAKAKKASPGAGAAPKPDDELRQMLEQVIERVLDNVDKHGWSIPMCLAHSVAGKNMWVVCDEVKGEQHDPKKSAASVLAQVRRMIKKKELRAIAFGRHVHLTVDSDKGPVESAAVKVLLDHQAGGGATAFLLFHKKKGKAVPDELFYNDPEVPFF